MASKIKDDQIKIRDVINVIYHLLNRNALDLGEEYFSIRDAIVQAELLIAHFHHSPKFLDYKVTHVAISCLSLALQTYGIQAPLTNESSESSVW
uniref:Uncharacterized protein n=1 Tax=Glossina palpalis gambiensis TaxID=67801 RepID=A0A1B0BRL0_9MUSC